MNALIIEDEDLLAKELIASIAEVDDSIRVIDVIPSLKVARKWFLSNPMPDLLFMDVQLSDGISFSLFEEYQISCPVIFTTAYDQYAVKAFKVNGVDYLLKPVSIEELRKALDKCRAILASKASYPVDMKQLLQLVSNNPESSRSLYKEKFIVHQRNQWLHVNTKDIACIMKDNLHYIITFSGDKFILSFESMDEIEELLNPSLFYRANRQFIVHVDAIQSVRPRENSKLTLTLKPPIKQEVDVSRDKAPDFRKWMDR